MKIELPIEEKARIEELNKKLIQTLYYCTKGKTPSETIGVITNAYEDLLRQTEAEKWFTKEREKETFNEMVRNYDEKLKEKDVIIDNLKRR